MYAIIRVACYTTKYQTVLFGLAENIPCLDV